MSAHNKPTPNKAAILAALSLLFTNNDVIELRCITKGGKKRVDAGYFDSNNWPALAEHAARINATGAAVYITLNPVDPQLLGRYNNRIEAYASPITTDSQVTRRRWLLIDLDPSRPTNTSATDKQLKAARDKARAVSKHLKNREWPDPMVAISGNGYHLLYAIDLPNDSESTALVKGVLQALRDRFDDDQIKVDTSVYNAGRICKLYGTVANKGDYTEATPWRMAELIKIPERVNVTVEQLRLLQPQPISRVTPQSGKSLPVVNTPLPLRSATQKNFNLEDFFACHSVIYSVDLYEGRERFKLSECPFNSEHVNGEAAVFRDINGKLGFKCFHDSCSDKDWVAVRERFDSPRVDTAKVGDWCPSSRLSTKHKFDENSAFQLGGWPEPTPLPTALPEVRPFAADLLPEALRAWVVDIAHQMQCPPDFSAMGAIAALSSLIGARHVIQPKVYVTDWQVVPNMWALIVGRPGVMKSPALVEVMKPLNKMAETESKQWKSEHDSWELDCKVAAMLVDANEKKAKRLASSGNASAARELLKAGEVLPEPIARSYVENDITVEKLGVILQDNPWGLIAYRDELYGLLTSLDKPGQEGSRSFFLQSYDGNQGYKFSRIGRGETYIPRVCMALLGGTQPGRIQQYVRDAVFGGSGDDGLLQRFGLAIWPDIVGDFQYVDKWPDTPAKQAAVTVYERLAKLEPESETEPVVWRFSEAAQALFIEWLVPFENEIREEGLHPSLASHLAKYRKLIPALALIFALIDTPDSGHIVHEAEFRRALAMGDYLRTHANRLYSAATTPETSNAASLLARITSRKLLDHDGVLLDCFTPRQVATKNWTGLGTPEAVRKAADVLADYDFLRRDVVLPGTSGGRPSERYLINPAVFKS